MALGLQSHPEPDKPHRPPRNAMVDYYSSETLDLSSNQIEYVDLYLSDMMHVLIFFKVDLTVTEKWRLKPKNSSSI